MARPTADPFSTLDPDNLSFNPTVGNPKQGMTGKASVKTFKAPFGINVGQETGAPTQQPMQARTTFPTFPAQNITPQPQPVAPRKPSAPQNQPVHAHAPKYDDELSGNISLSGEYAKPVKTTDTSYQYPQETSTFIPKDPTAMSPEGSGDILDEPPLLEDLGINLESIKTKTLSVIAFTKCDEKFLEESDMAGPLLFGFILGGILLLSGKVQFGYIYGFGALGSIFLYLLMNCLSMSHHLNFYDMVSILGYCLIPIVILSAFSLILNMKSYFGLIFGGLAVIWSTYRATYFSHTVLGLDQQKWLVAYPILLFYSIFVLLTIF